MNEDLLNLLSILIGLQNLQENREQTAQNDVQVANANQLKEINKRFDDLNAKIDTILNLLQNERE